MPTATLRIGLAPGRNNPDLQRWQVVADGAKVNDTRPHVAFTTEMGEHGEDYADFRRGLGSGDYRAATNTARSENPIVFDFDRMKQGRSSHHPVATPGHSGERRYFYPGTSPTRSIEVAELTPRNLETDEPIDELLAAYLGGHFTAFSKYAHSRRYPAGSSERRWCDANWRANRELLGDLIADQHRAGRLVVSAADFNCPLDELPTFGKGQRWLISGGIDGVLVVPAPKGKGPVLTEVSRTRVVEVWSDHHYRERTVRLVAR